MWSEEYFIEGFRFISTAEYEMLRDKVKRLKGKACIVLSPDEWRDYSLYEMNMCRGWFDFHHHLRICHEPPFLGNILVLLNEINRRIDIVLERDSGQKSLEQIYEEKRIENVVLIDEMTSFKLNKLIHKKEVDKQAIHLCWWLNNLEEMRKISIIGANMVMYNIGARPTQLGHLLLYRRELENRVKYIRSSKEYQWFLNKDGDIVGRW